MKPALLLVDLQGDYLSARGLHPDRITLTLHVAELLEECRRRAIPIIHVWTTIRRQDDRRMAHWKESNRWQCVEGTPGHFPPAQLLPVAGETVVHKTGFNAFVDSRLKTALVEFGCDLVIIAGLHLHACVRSAATECLERGLRVVIAEDGTGSDDPIHAAATRRWLAHRCVRFHTNCEIFGALDVKNGASLIHRSPRDTSRILFETPIAGADQIADAAAQARLEWGRWRITSVNARCCFLEKLAREVDKAAPSLARQMAAEVGKPLSYGLEEVRRAAANIRDVIERAARFEFLTRSAAGTVCYAPLGVVALISPWNNPVAIPLGKIAPALACGNTVVWKPAPAATNISRAVLKLLRKAGVPLDAIQMVTGDHSTAQRLAADKSVDAVTVTASAKAGFALAEICARRCVPLQAELSGNNAAVVWDDADFEQAATEIATGAFGFAGQRCTANRRVIVNRKYFKKFERLVKLAAEKLVWGDPLKSATAIGPVISEGKRREHAAMVRAAEDAGATRRVDWLHSNLAASSWVGKGAYAQPVILCCDDADHPIAQEESMSPMLVVQRAETFSEALQLCNRVRHGLAAALFSNSPKLKRLFLAEAKAGILKINSSTAGVDVTLPFGGWKSSGFGPPEHGEADRLFYTRMKAVYERA